MSKALQLIVGLGLTEPEVYWLLNHPADFDDLDLNKLPLSKDEGKSATALFTQFVRLADYSRLKHELAGDTLDMIRVFERARRTHPAAADAGQARTLLFDDVCARIAEITRREVGVVQAAASRVGFTAQSSVNGGELLVELPELANEKGIDRLWQALQLVERGSRSIRSSASAG